MQVKKFIPFIILLFIFSKNLIAQTVEKPIVIKIMTDAKTVSHEYPSYVVVQLKAPNGILLGVEPKEARTPPGTKITPKNISGFHFEKPIFPEPKEEWIPAKLGKAKVLKETVNIVVPFSVDKNVSPGAYDLTFYITYTPSYNAGKLSTHVKEEYSININVASSSKKVIIPQPSIEPTSSDFYVKPKSFDDIPSGLRFMFKPLNEENALIKGLHKIWIDKPGHGKTVRFMPFPSMSSTNITSLSAGMGAAFFNSTKEGTMTGMISMSGSYNDLIGGILSLRAISCPGAYYNYQFLANFGGEGYRDISLHHENFTVANSKFGYDFSFRSLEEPRMRFYGIGNETVGENETAYRQTNLHTALDLYSVGIQNFRFGVGVSYDDYDVGTSFEKLRTSVENIDYLQNSSLSNGLLGIDESSLLSLKVNFIYDRKDQEFTPATGFYSKLTLSRNSISNTENNLIAEDYYGLNLDMRQYFSGPSQNLIVLMRAGLDLKSESNLPFYMLSSLGGPNSMRAYDFERYLGQHAAFISAEMRYTLFSATILGYPMDIEMGAFLDVGQIFGDSVDIGDGLKVDPGFSIRMINKPNVGVIMNYAFGDDGGYFTGGIGLPF